MARKFHHIMVKAVRNAMNPISYCWKKQWKKRFRFLEFVSDINRFNVFCGGTLYQDIPHELNSNITHWQGEPYTTPAHSVKVEEGSIVHKIFGKSEIDVNSIHHQGVKTIAPSLRATSISPDGVIESFENQKRWSIPNGSSMASGTDVA